MLIGYARISTSSQNLDLQIDALQKAGCEKIFQDQISGSLINRPALELLLKEIRKGDVLIIWKLDRLGRSFKDLIDLVNTLLEKGVGIKSLNDPIDTTTPQGRLIFNIFGSLAEFERELIKERTIAGLEAARARGKKGGRPKGLSKKALATAHSAELLYKEGRLSVSEICEQLAITRATFYKYLRLRNVMISSENQRKRCHSSLVFSTVNSIR
ncbi:site-specific DNA recombinase, e14 prophage [Legionella quinlivanii]|uniref:Site-specific DNA recombinase, e14 prophage n=2 Tax=Legionella TaxID=445 RepID=A0A0W0XTC8_9GAMM|nr:MULTISPECIES: recombinase family protein [Legionella]KTC71466.1 site-specific DNA recombinase, e14 prophage [Legionella birminghamensis]KTD48081.1 site-specific DNA recombinase, e14 prophage [Legionella quinlivanii]SEG48609.1 Site-specific DNA recombinase [Legionella quinlivanii DSM 21216]STX60865.1 site-specific DNA recombinase; e14 prophage [Legionella birminghamensis]STY49785.1 site-specific DNA recombinase; e14 prophage [Legionella quinlivanii]